ncbi:MAG: 2-dehydropantoate 2-reductase N-terminal domain-containing protein [Terriglobales bacterium]|jgi:2-dehydropantoate 2-reductase
MRHAILGAGGVGGVIGASLARCGEDVTLVVRPDKLAAHPRQIQLEGALGDWSGEVEWAATAPPADVLWLTVKGTQLESALDLITDPASVGAIVPLLNGIDHLKLLRSKYGVERVIPATIAGEMERIGTGHFVHRSPFLILNMAAQGRELLGPLCERLRPIGFTCNFIGDEATLMWGKLVFLGPFALTTSAFDRTIGDVLADADTMRQLEGCVRETCAAALAEGAKIDTENILRLMKGAPPGMRSSMQKDIANGRPPELDAIGGTIVRAVKRHGLKASMTEDLMMQIERRLARPVNF